MNQNELIPHLFRTEFRKITAVLCRHFGLGELSLAEDLASETFLAALETWPYRGIPDQPVAWLYTVARNKARNRLKRDQVFAARVAKQVKEDAAVDEAPDIDLSEANIADSSLQMLFAICHPALSAEAQIGLALRILCGFGIDEIASAFLTSREVINKRLFRAREKLRTEKIAIAFPPPAERKKRIQNVVATLYLLFSEGYYSECRNDVLREDLCLEAMRLAYGLAEHPETRIPEVNALLALMCFHASRFGARKSAAGDLVLYEDQDRSLWNGELIAKGGYFLHRATGGDTLSAYHLEAAIAYWHTQGEDHPGKWESVLQLYDHLLQVRYTPVAALNRTYALAKVKGKEAALVEVEKLQLNSNPYYHALLGELYRELNPARAKEQLEKALALAGTEGDRKVVLQKLAALEPG